LTLETSLIVVGALVGGFVNGLTGFGTGITALVFWLYALQPVVAAPLVAACSVVGQLQALPMLRATMDLRRLAPFLAGGLPAVPVGAWLVAFTPVTLVKLGLGVLLVTSSSFLLFWNRPARRRVGGQRGDAAVGLIGGVLGGLAGLSGVLVTLWVSLQPWGRDERRAVFQGFNLVVLASVLVVYGVMGQLSSDFFRAFLLALPGTVIGAYLGQVVYQRLADETFRRLVLGLLLIAGLMLVVANIGAA
jgi:uncharacterized membrane protein YfcA